MQKPQITLASFLLLAAALPIWIFLTVELSLILPLTLSCLTMAICLGVIGEKRRNAWALSALLAAVTFMAPFLFLKILDICFGHFGPGDFLPTHN